jgi:polar amino acid transport system substrate-binding protein
MNRTLVILLSLLAAAPAAAAPLRVLAYQTEPFFYSSGGKPAGLEFEILEYYAKATGRTLEVTWTDQFETIVETVANGQVDIAAATLTITPERQDRVSFSTSYFPVRVMLVEPRGQVTTDLRQLAGASLATIRATTYEEILSTVPRAQMVYGVEEKDLFELVASGKARAAAADSAIALTLLPRYPQLRLGMALSAEQGFGFAVPKGSPLAADLSRHIAQLKASKIYFRLLEKHLGAEAARMVAAGREP